MVSTDSHHLTGLKDHISVSLIRASLSRCICPRTILLVPRVPSWSLVSDSDHVDVFDSSMNFCMTKWASSSDTETLGACEMTLRGGSKGGSIAVVSQGKQSKSASHPFSNLSRVSNLTRLFQSALLCHVTSIFPTVGTWLKSLALRKQRWTSTITFYLHEMDLQFTFHTYASRDGISLATVHSRQEGKYIHARREGLPQAFPAERATWTFKLNKGV